MVNDHSAIVDRYDAVIFDVGNTLVRQSNPGTPVGDLRPELLTGVAETIAALHRKVKLGIVSNTTSMTSADLKHHLAAVGIGEAFDFVLATADLGVHKPDPQPLKVALGALGVTAEVTLYVGDNEIDRIAAERAGMGFTFTGPNLFESLVRHGRYPISAFVRAKDSVRRPDEKFAMNVHRRFDGLVKPVGSLGVLEGIVARIAAIQHTDTPSADPCGAVIFCADHGIAVDDTVTPWPREISATMAAVIASGRAVSSVFARAGDIYLEIVDVGLARQVDHDRVRDESVRRGTADLRFGAALDRDQVIEALEVGAKSAERIIAGGSRMLCVGEVGMGNTTVSAALISHFCGVAPVDVTGRGAGIDDATLDRKRVVVSDAVASVAGLTDPISVAAAIGGLEVVAMTGFIIGAGSLGVPVVLDGVVTQAAACLADAIVPGVATACIAGHRSAEPASRVALEHLRLEPILSLNMRLGEGTGAMLTIPVLRAACRALSEVAPLADIM
jgi:nicotinate-nucleotide--dimethylbenzimidazole phosphoribosyltransferase